jgi:ELWxxDGT repeat protein
MKKSIILSFFICLVSMTSLKAQLPVCVKDINPISSQSANPYDFCVYNGLLYFSATDGTHGEALWRTDGTDSGTIMIKYDTTHVFDPRNFIVFNNKLFFRAYDNTHGTELWTSDGTTAGTQLFKDISTGSGGGMSNGPSNNIFTIMGTKLYFYAETAASGLELWVSDGTSSGTVMLKDIYPGSNDAINPGEASPLVQYNNKLYFTANDSTHGFEPWYTDGTTAGTQMLKDIVTGINGYYWPFHFTPYNNKLYFAAYDPTNGTEFWSTNGTSAGTLMVKDIKPGTGSSFGVDGGIFISHTIGIGNTKLFFFADDGVHGYELWKSDGTSAGTTMVKDVLPGHSSSNIPDFGWEFGFYNNSVFLLFTANDSVHGWELWKTDGTTAGTTIVYDINPDPNEMGAFCQNYTSYHGKIYFIADDGTNGTELWRTDGTAAETEKVSPAIVTKTDPIGPLSYKFISFDGAMYFSADYNSLDRELWKLDIPYIITTSSMPVAGGNTSGGGGYHQGDTVTLVATPNPGYNFVNWTESGFNVDSSSTYEFICGIWDHNFVANFEQVGGIDANSSPDILISPNPVNSELNIKVASEEIKLINVYDISGKLILSSGELAPQTNKTTLDFSGTEPGMYYVSISGKDFISTKKIIKL